MPPFCAVRRLRTDGIFFNYHYHKIKILIIFLAVHNYININARCLAALRKIRHDPKNAGQSLGCLIRLAEKQR